MSQYVVEYTYQGKTFVIDTPAARNEKDARDHIRSAYFNGQVQEVVFRAKPPSVLGKLIERFK